MSIVLYHQPHFRASPRTLRSSGVLAAPGSDRRLRRQADVRLHRRGNPARTLRPSQFRPHASTSPPASPAACPTSPACSCPAQDGPPAAGPKSSKNLAFVSQFVEIPDDVVFTVEYSVRAAQMAVYQLLGDKAEDPAAHPARQVDQNDHQLDREVLRLNGHRQPWVQARGIPPATPPRERYPQRTHVRRNAAAPVPGIPPLSRPSFISKPNSEAARCGAPGLRTCSPNARCWRRPARKMHVPIWPDSAGGRTGRRGDAVVRFPGGPAAGVSPRGLLTNVHAEPNFITLSYIRTRKTSRRNPRARPFLFLYCSHARLARTLRRDFHTARLCSARAPIGKIVENSRVPVALPSNHSHLVAIRKAVLHYYG